MLTNLDAFRDNHTAPCTGLTCVLGIHGNDLRTSFYRFVRKDLSEHAQTRIMCGEGEIAAGHKRQVQIFNHDCAVGFSELGSCLVPEVFALVGNVLVKLCNPLDSLAPSGAKLFLAGKLAVQNTLFCKRVAQPSGIVDPVAVAQGSEAKHTNVKPNGLTSVQAYFDVADVLNVQPVIDKLTAVTVAVLQRLKAVASLEAGKATDSLIERFVGFIETTKHLLNRRNVEQPHIFGAVVPLNLDSLPLVNVADRLARPLPHPPTLVERVIVDGLHLKQNIIKNISLLSGRREPILVRENQLEVLLIVDVPLNRFSGYAASRTDKVASCPHVRQSAFQMRKFITQLKSCVAFQPVHDLVWRKRGRETTKQMNVINLHREIEDFTVKLFRLFVQKGFEACRYITIENFASIFRYPNKVIVNVVDCVSCSFRFHSTSVQH